MKKRSAIVLLLVLLTTAGTLYAQSPSEYTRSNDGLTTFVLENGMEVYLLPSAETPVAQVIFAVKAGYGSQTPETTGVPELYSRLFFSAGEKGLYGFTEAGATDLYASCFTDVVHYSLQCPDIALLDVLAMLSRCAIDPRLSNSEIETAHSVLFDEKQQWAESVSGYINSATDTVIFSNAPWQFDTGIFPESFQRSSTEELRGMLASHAEKYYTPNNSAIFIATSQESSTVLSKVKELYGGWKRGAYTVSAPMGMLNPMKNNAGTDNYSNYTGNTGNDESAGKKYVLVSDDFSPDFNQFIVQYVGMDSASDMSTIAAWQTAALVLQENRELAEQLTSGDSGIEDYSLYNISFTQASSVPRLIFQCLSDSRKQAPDMQANAIIDSLKSPDLFTEEGISRAKERITAQAVSARTKTSLLLEAVALNWAYGGSSYFYDFPAVTAGLSSDQISAVTGTEPVLFILLHTNIWKKYRNTLDRAGFTLISADNAAWYTKKQYEKQRSLALGITREPDAVLPTGSSEEQTVAASSISSYSTGADSMTRFTLSNGIPVLIRREPHSQGVTVRITISGGESQHPARQRGLETATILAASENIRKNIGSRSFDAIVTEQTGLWSSSITITTAAPYADDAVSAIGKALFYETITTSQADGILYNMQYQWRLKQGSLDFQMLCDAMQQCYGSSPAGAWYTSSGDLLTEITMPILTKAYADLLSPERYAIILIAETPESYLPQLEKVFGSILQPRYIIPSAETSPAENIPQIPDITRYVTLNHIFTTDIKPEDAGPRPLHLIPTTKFDDPVHYYFSGPSITSDAYPLFMALMYELEETLNRQWVNGVELNVICPESPIIQVIFKSVPQRTDVFPIFAATFNALQNEHSPEQVRLLKTRAIPKLFGDNAALMEQSWLYGGDSTIYTRQYQALELAQWQDFDAALDVLRPQFNILELLSDTRNSGR